MPSEVILTLTLGGTMSMKRMVGYMDLQRDTTVIEQGILIMLRLALADHARGAQDMIHNMQREFRGEELPSARPKAGNEFWTVLQLLLRQTVLRKQADTRTKRIIEDRHHLPHPPRILIHQRLNAMQLRQNDPDRRLEDPLVVQQHVQQQ